MRRTKTFATIGTSTVVAVLLLAACSSNSGPPSAPTSPGATKGGVLSLVGQNNVNSLDTANGYLPVSYGLDRAISRQLYTWPTAPTLAGQVNPVPDMATAMPKITNGGKTYTVTIRSGVKWDTNPPRRVTAADEVLGMKRLCNPASPTEAPGYFESTILGMQSYCSAFSLVAPDAANIKTFIETHTIQGVKAIGTETVQFTLTQPSSDFIDVLSLPFSSPVPVEELSYVPGSLQLAQHFVSDGPYTIRSYVPGTSFDLVRNPLGNPPQIRSATHT